MTFKYTTIGGKTDYVHGVTVMIRIGTHTYEFLYHTPDARHIQRKMRVVEVAALECNIRCGCHNELECPQ